jgi:hypothetical protein
MRSKTQLGVGTAAGDANGKIEQQQTAPKLPIYWKSDLGLLPVPIFC